MRLLVFAVYDVKAEMYGVPFMLKTKADAVRGFSDLASDKNTTVGRHPGDFKLQGLGTWDDVTGEFYSDANLDSLGFASDFLGGANNPNVLQVVS